MSLINREKLCVNHEKSAPKNHHFFIVSFSPFTSSWENGHLSPPRSYDDTAANANANANGKPKKHINFFNINFLAPTLNTLVWAARKKVDVPHFLGKDAKKGAHINFFGGIFGVKKGAPNGPFSATKSLVYCAAKVAERKKTKNNPFFHLKLSEFCVLNAPTKSAVGWNCIKPEATSLTMQGFMSPPRRFSCPIAVVAIAWNNCANTQRLGGAEKSWRPVRDFLREKFAKKNAFLSAEIWVWKREKKSQTIFSDFWSWSVCMASFSKSHTRRRFFSSTAVSVELAMLPACDPSLSNKCALWKSSKTLQRVLVVSAWQGALHENNREKLEKNLMTRFCTGRGAKFIVFFPALKFWRAPRHSLANFCHQMFPLILLDTDPKQLVNAGARPPGESKQRCELSDAKEFASECEWFCERHNDGFVPVTEVPCEWMSATKFASDCECDGVAHSDGHGVLSRGGGLWARIW